MQFESMKFHDKETHMMLPQKTIIYLFCEMTKIQKKMYEEAKISGSNCYSNMKKVASHPQLYDEQVASEGSSGMFQELFCSRNVF